MYVLCQIGTGLYLANNPSENNKFTWTKSIDNAFKFDDFELMESSAEFVSAYIPVEYEIVAQKHVDVALIY